MFITEQGGIDWVATANWARTQTKAALETRIQSNACDLTAIDRLDRELGTNKGGLIRDEISVYRTVLEELQACPTCGRI